MYICSKGGSGSWKYRTEKWYQAERDTQRQRIAAHSCLQYNYVMYWNFVPCLYRSKGTGSSKTAKCAVQVSRKRPNSASTRPISCQLSSAVGMTSVSVIMQELAAQIAATCSEVTHAQKSTVGCIPCVQAVRQLNNPHCADSREVCR